MIEKTRYIRSEKLRRLVASLPCQLCGIEGQTQAAHSNQSKHGKGKSIKSSDEFIAALCITCHTAIDSGPASLQSKRITWDVAHERTKAAIPNWDELIIIASKK